MSANEVRPNPDQKPPARRTIRDVPGCIKYIILLFLLILLFGEYYAGEYRGFPDVSQIVWLIIFIKLLLILLLIILIWVQRKLNCDLTAPVGCTNVEYDSANDMWFIRVKGTASGTVFGNYTLAVERPPGTPYPATIIYPGGGGSGTAIVNNGELGRIDVTSVEPAPMRVILTVNPAGAGSPCVHTSDFDWANRTTSIAAIGAVAARWVGGVKLITGPAIPAPPGPPVSVGGGITADGTADYTGCGREMVEYALDRKIVNVGESPWPGTNPGPWTNILSPLPFGDPAHPRTFLYLEGASPATHYNTVRSLGKLTRIWSIGDFLMPPPPPPENTAPRAFTQPVGWDTRGEGLNGRYTVRLTVKHQLIGGPPPPIELYDTATVWIDNRDIEGRIWNLGIVGGGPIGVCDEILMSQFITPTPLGSPPPGGPFTVNLAAINGRAWDPVILNSYLLPGPVADEPNDNFDKYKLDFKKNGDVLWVDINESGTRAPNILQELPLAPLPANLALLASWDIVAALDAGPPQAAPAPYPKIYRGERCAYLIRLQAWDKTKLGDSGTVHYVQHDFPFCIMNDLPVNLKLPEPEL